MRNRLMAIALMLMFVVVIAGCAGSSGGSSSKPPIKIGALFDMSGATADVGTPHSEGARAYIEYINSKGGVGGRQIQLIWEDYAYNNQKATEIYKKLQQEQVVAIMGWGTGDTEALRPLVSKDKIPFISGSYAETLINPAETPYNFIVAPTYSQQARLVMDYAKSKNPQAKIGMIFHDSAFGRSPLEHAKQYASKIGVTWAGEAALPGNAADATTQVLDLANKGANFIIIQNVTNGTALALKAAKAQNLLGKIQFLGLAYSTDEGLIKAASDAAEGFVGIPAFSFPYESGNGIKEAVDYAKSKGVSDKLSQKWVQGWAFGRILVEAVKKAGNEPTGDSVRKALETFKDYDLGGLGGSLTFTDKDHGGAKKGRLYQVKGGKWEMIQDYTAPKAN